MAGQAFRRSKLIFAALHALNGMAKDSSEYDNALASLPNYFSRGKGGKKAVNKTHVHMAHVRKSTTAHNIAKRK